MPELPEVEVARLIARRVAVGRVITAVRCADDPIVLDGAGPTRLRRALVRRRVTDVRRHGKYLWFPLDRRPWPVIHFGMTGGFHTPEGRGVKLISSGDRDPDGAWPPRFTKLHLVFDDGGQLIYADARRLGRVRLRHDPRHEPPISLLGFDAYREIPALERFHELLRARGAPLKAVLLDQTFAAGVGNWIADEVLYQARLDPHRRAHTLTREEAARLRARLRAVVALSVRVRSDSDRYPRSWLFHYRWGKHVGAVTGRGEAIRYVTLGGRTTAWVPTVQR
jgi:formamidopyrimidine-DNA glycosylase